MRARGLVVLAVVLASATPAAVSVGDEPSTTFTVAFAGAVPVGPGDAFHGGVVERVSAPLGFAAVLTPDPGLFALRARADPAVRWIEPVGEVHVEGHRNGTLADRQYALDQIRAPVANTTFVVGLASVCFVDSGFNPHEDVDVAALLKGTANFTGSQAGVVDRLGHGTFVAGVVAANASNGRGIDGLGHIPFYVAKAIADSGTGTAFDTADAIAWCADRPDERLVVSLSLGTRTAARSLQEAVAYADARGRLIVAAAGNEGCSPCVIFPAAFPEVVAVACTSRFEQRCRFSSAGPEVELAAPGAGILGLARDGKSYTSFSGTSMSTPHVAGAAALAWNASPTLTSEALRKLLQVSAQKLPGMPPGEERDTKFGYGELDVQCLLSEGVGSPACAQPAPPATCAPVDAFGYRCFASGALSRPPDALYLDDPGEGEVDLGFALDFYGLKFSRAFVSPAGLVTFGGSCSAPCKPASFPHPTGPNGFVAAGWSEDPAGKVLLSRHPTTGDVFLEWFDKPADLAPRAVLAIRNGSGDLEVDAAGVADGLVGIEDPSGSTGVRAPTARVVLASPGTAPPGPPEGLVAAPRAGVTTWIDVAWDVPASGAYGVQRYEVWRSTEPDEDGVLLGLTQATRFADDVDRSCEGCATRGRTDSFHYSVRAIGPGGHGSFARTCSGLVPFAACLDLSDVVQTDGGLP